MNSEPESYAIKSGEIHVWKVALASEISDLEDMPAVLSTDELERASRFTFEHDQARFVSCRASLRLILCRYTCVAPSHLVFRYEARGKPSLSGIDGWQFNVSHSRNLAAIAVSRQDSVGIDLELIDPFFPRDEVAPDILNPEELSDLAAHSPETQAEYFFQLWTSKESLLKACGSGLSLEPRDLHIRLDKAENPQIVSAPPKLARATLHRLTLDPGFTSALAVMGQVKDLEVFTL